MKISMTSSNTTCNPLDLISSSNTFQYKVLSTDRSWSLVLRRSIDNWSPRSSICTGSLRISLSKYRSKPHVS